MLIGKYLVYKKESIIFFIKVNFSISLGSLLNCLYFLEAKEYSFI